MSTRRVLPQLGVELVDLREAHCCGNIVESVNRFAATYMAARVLALAGETGLRDLLLPCSRCHFTLSEAQHLLTADKKLKEKIALLLNEEKLNCSLDIKVWHIIDFLHDAIGIDKIREKVKRSLRGLRFASHIGCQAIRPSYIRRVDNSESPQKMDRLIETLGAESVDYPEKLDCCGAALIVSNQTASLSLAGSKLKSLSEIGIDGLVNSCPAGHMMFDARQEDATSTIGRKLSVPVLYYTQLLGLSMKFGEDELGLQLNKSPTEKILEKLS